MDPTVLKVLGAITSPAKWLFQLCTDQTRIEVVLSHGEQCSSDSIPVQNTGDNTGLLMFGVTTRAKQQVEISRVEVQYAAPLQLVDPGHRGFFVGGGTLDSELPFCVGWDGSAAVRSDVQQAFALTARFPNRAQEGRLRISIHARRQHSAIGGFVSQGRLQVSTKEIIIKLVSGPVLGLPVSPLCSLTTPQPFLIESEVTASALHLETISLVAHTRDSDGTPESTRIEHDA